MWRLECKGYHSDDNGNFTAIVPVWSEYSRLYYLQPINHIRITGVWINDRDFDHSFDKEWHPDNPFSEEKYIECKIIRCKWEQGERRGYIIKSMQDMGYPQEYNNKLYNTYRYFVPAKQLIPLHEHSTIQFKSKDREKEECEIYRGSWSSMASGAIARSYY